MTKKAAKTKPIKLAVGQRWVYREGGKEQPPIWDDTIAEIAPGRVETTGEVGVSWDRRDFRRVHSRLRDPSELVPVEAAAAVDAGVVALQAALTDRDRWKADAERYAQNAEHWHQKHDRREQEAYRFAAELTETKRELDKATAERDGWESRAKAFEAGVAALQAGRAKTEAALDERDQLRAEAESRTAGLELQLAAAREQYEVESHRSAVELGQYREELRVLMRRLLAEMARGGGA